MDSAIRRTLTAFEWEEIVRFVDTYFASRFPFWKLEQQDELFLAYPFLTYQWG